MRLAHVDPASIKAMCENGSVRGLYISKSTKSNRTCNHCILGKGRRHSFPKASSSHTSNLLELVHSDVNEPLETPFLCGSRYFTAFIDDYAKWTVVYMMKKKSESLQCFTKYHKMAETHTGNRINTVNTIHREKE